MKAIDYAQARTEICDGDLIFVRGGKSFWSRVIQKATGSDVFHCGIAFWVRDPRYPSRLFILEAHQGGRRIISLSSYAQHSMVVIVSPTEWNLVCDVMLDKAGSVPYSLLEFMWIGALELFGIRRKVDDEGEVCSKMVALYCKQGGMEIETDISPAALKTFLIDAGNEIRCMISNKLPERKRNEQP